jgi:hypothetical protein
MCGPEGTRQVSNRTPAEHQEETEHSGDDRRQRQEYLRTDVREDHDLAILCQGSSRASNPNDAIF